jgi:hypothetical protein
MVGLEVPTAGSEGSGAGLEAPGAGFEVSTVGWEEWPVTQVRLESLLAESMEPLEFQRARSRERLVFQGPGLKELLVMVLPGRLVGREVVPAPEAPCRLQEKVLEKGLI